MVTVTISETYDLSTRQNRMGMLAIHTPSSDTIARQWSGFMQNFKFMRVRSCDVVLACASLLPADPQQVGVEAGDIAPQDMFNPILYTAVSNDSFGTLMTRLYTLGKFNNVDTASVDYDPTPLPAGVDDWGVYYSLLSDKHGWKHAMPQQGLRMFGLHPLVHQISSNIGVNKTFSGNDALDSWDLSEDALHKTVVTPALVKGPSMRLPRMPTMYWNTDNNNTEQMGSTIQMEPAVIPATYVGAIILPPAKLSVLYYRLVVEWKIDFEEVVSNVERSSLSNLAWEGNNRFYYTDYAEQSEKMDVKTSLVDGIDTEFNRVM